MADFENDASQNQNGIKSENAETNSLCKKLDQILLTDSSTSSSNDVENGVELNMEATACSFHSNGISLELDFGDQETRFENGRVMNSDHSDAEAKNNSNHVQSAAEDHVEIDQNDKMFIESKSNNESPEEIHQENSENAEEKIDHTKFETINHVCPVVEASQPLDDDFHVGSKHLFVNVDQEIKEKNHPHNKLCQGEQLEWFDNQHQADTIHRLNIFRKHKKFCDLVLLVGGYEIYCHRVVVGSASSAIYDELCLGEQESGPVARIPIDASKPGLSSTAVEILIEYMYTSRLMFDCEHLTAVYRAALQLGVERVIPICRQHVIKAVDTDQCIQMRRLAQNYGDIEMKNFMDNYIEENFEAVSICNEFLSLPRIKMEVMVSPNPSVANLLSISPKEGRLISTALIWISNVIKGKGGSYLEDLTEQIQRLTLEDLNATASFCTNEHNMRRISQETEHRRSSEGSGGYATRNRLTRASSMDSLKSSDSNDSMSRSKCDPDGEWKVIASIQVRGTDHMIAQCCLGDVLCALSIRISNAPSSNGDLPNGQIPSYNHVNHFSSVSSSSASCCSSIGSFFQYCPMNQPRSAAGVAQIDGKIIVAGGFNQSESLNTVECFDVSSNRWSGLTRMNDKRGRFSVAVLDGQLFAVGGSTGSHDLSSVERYEPHRDTWTHLQSLPFSCSGSGVAVLYGRLYCIGGVRQNIGIAGLKACLAYDPASNKWEYRASLHTGRTSLGVATLGNHLYAVAGSDGWKCLSSAEKYDPVTNHWTFTAALNINRRGLGLTEHNGSLYCVGGSDGQSFLSSVERYSPMEGDLWTLTSWTLGVPRNCAGVTSANNSVFVVGGFSGRQFLSSVEAMEDSAAEWSSHDSPSSKSASSDAKDSSSSSE